MAFDQNTRTLIATFEDYSTARHAASDLMNNGIPSDAIQIDSDQKTAGAGSGGTTAASNEVHESGFASWWHSLFGTDRNDDERDTYEQALASGSTLLRATVRAEDVDTAVDILNREGAVDIERSSGRDAVRSSRSTALNDTTRPIPIIEEELQVGKRSVQRGGVRIYSHVVTEPVEQQVNLHEEHVNVDRRKVDREVSPDELSRLRDQTIEVTETAEEPVIAKRARVREEVVVGKEGTDHTETIRDNVRRTEVKVENLGSTRRETPGSEPSTSGTVGSDAASSATPSGARRDTSDRQTVTTQPSGADMATPPPVGRATVTGPSSNRPSTSVPMGSGFTPGAGTLAGEATAGSAIQDFTAQDFTSDYRRNFEAMYGSNSDFETMRPAYEYGYRSASDPRYKDRSWDQVENGLRSDYERTYPGSRWDQAKSAVRYGWEKMTRKV